jgi:hypothetical protein
MKAAQEKAIEVRNRHLDELLRIKDVMNVYGMGVDPSDPPHEVAIHVQTSTEPSKETLGSEPKQLEGVIVVVEKVLEGSLDGQPVGYKSLSLTP